ncbi:hypothetical protein HC028_26315 [Planosporangium flavigriseum]|nr:hypothetical protein [Planosporangium flavigriseum]NJC67994.1 hypothetical protein [Planosporangium flavigriseum]
MDEADIARIKRSHRASVRWIGTRVIVGCSCGVDRYPCELRRAAEEAERK